MALAEADLVGLRFGQSRKAHEPGAEGGVSQARDPLAEGRGAVTAGVVAVHQGPLLGLVLTGAIALLWGIPTMPTGLDAISFRQVEEWHVNPATKHAYATVDDLTWQEAEAFAVRLGGHLVSINDHAEWAWLQATFTRQGLDGRGIGLSDGNRESVWVWSSGEPLTYTAWNTDWPHDCTECDPDGEDVAMILTDGASGVFGWTDIHEEVISNTVIEVPAVPTTGSISGTIVAPGGGSPQIDVDALVHDPRNGEWVIAASTMADAADGATATHSTAAYVIDGLPPGDYLVRFRGGAGFVDQYWTYAAYPDAARPVPVDAGRVISGVDGQVFLTATITGRVTVSDDAVADVAVTADLSTPGGWVAFASVRTGSDGAYVLPDLPPGAYRVSFEDPAGRFAPAVYATDPLTSPTLVEVDPGTTTNDIDAELEPALLVPTLTTYIPTPREISTEPPVVGANLLFAAVAMILFTIAGELLNRTLADNEDLLARLIRPAGTVGRLRERADGAIRRVAGTGRLLTITRLLGIAAIYGFVFSLLDPTWQPLSLTGVWLFLSMAIAFGVVGIADDLACWARARRWGAAAELDLRAANLVIALASTAVSRVAVLTPGIMIGMPEALQVDDEHLDQRRREQLAVTGLGTIAVVGGGAWLLTAGTDAVSSATTDGDLTVLAAGLQAFLLVLFAVAVQNLFAQLLTFRGTPGRVIQERHRVVWSVGLLGVTFLFWHTLVNPRGDLASALQTTNVLAFLATALGFVVAAVAMWAILRMARPRQTRGGHAAGVA